MQLAGNVNCHVFDLAVLVPEILIERRDPLADSVRHDRMQKRWRHDGLGQRLFEIFLPGLKSLLLLTRFDADVVTLTRTDEETNMARFYRLDVQPTLFGEWSVVREWGRIGRPGTVRVEVHGTRGAADVALIAKWSQKRKRGYQ